VLCLPQAVQSAMSHSIRHRDVAGEGPLGNYMYPPATVRVAVRQSGWKKVCMQIFETRHDFLGASSAFVARPPKLRNVDASGWLLDYSRGDEPGE
jgi:hypothetical protein